MHRKLMGALLVLAIPFGVPAQGLGDMFGDEETVDYTFATFKSTHLIIGPSIEKPADGNLLFVISHHFGTLNSGPYDLFGLDQSTIRIGFEYGLGEKLSLGIGRSSFEKTFDGIIKYKLLRQSTGTKNVPVTVSWYSDIVLKSTRWAEPERVNFFSSRLSYTHSLLIARKFSNALSLQMMPTVVHKNLVASSQDKNDIIVMGVGGRLKLTQRTTLNAEYFYILPNQISAPVHNSLSIGFDIETGGHVFQIHFTNSLGMFSRNFMTETTGSWLDGDVVFGFNIARTFALKKPAEFAH